jgi:SAM-dependent methyltransferase
MTSPRTLMNLLHNADKALEVVQAAMELGVLEALDGGAATLGELAYHLGLRPMRLYKLLECLGTLGFVSWSHRDDVNDTVYRPVSGAYLAAMDVLGSSERTRLADVLRDNQGAVTWPLTDEEQIAAFERGMAAELVPIGESFRANAERLWAGACRVLDVGGGNGAFAAQLLGDQPDLTVDVYNLSSLRPLVERTRRAGGWETRLGFVAGDFLTDPLPAGYDVLTFVRVLHDWSHDEVESLLAKAFDTLEPGGRVIVCEELRRPVLQFYWSYFLIGVDSAGLLRDTDAYRRLLRAAGFTAVEVLPGPFEVIVADRPRD